MRFLGPKSKRSKILPTLTLWQASLLLLVNVVEFEFAIVDQVMHTCILYIRLSVGIEFVFSKVLIPFSAESSLLEE